MNQRFGIVNHVLIPSKFGREIGFETYSKFYLKHFLIRAPISELHIERTFLRLQISKLQLWEKSKTFYKNNSYT